MIPNFTKISPKCLLYYILYSVIACIGRFFVADKAVGAKGFKAVWTEIRDGPGCTEFLCQSSSFCIDRSLKCNGINNCGQDDRSDEDQCKPRQYQCLSYDALFVVQAWDRYLQHSVSLIWKDWIIRLPSTNVLRAVFTFKSS